MAGVLGVYSNPMSKGLRIKSVAVTRSMTTATQVAKLPKGANIVGFVLSGIQSDAGTTATLSIGSTSSSNEYVSAVSVRTGGSGNGVNLLAGVAGAVGQSVLSADTWIYAKYAETGTASTVGSWVLHIIYADAARTLG